MTDSSLLPPHTFGSKGMEKMCRLREKENEIWQSSQESERKEEEDQSKEDEEEMLVLSELC